MARSTFSPLPVADTSVNEVFPSVGSQAAWRQPSVLMSELKG
jgi:hypothetical protein